MVEANTKIAKKLTQVLTEEFELMNRLEAEK
jgi:hypothetical protein